MTDQQERPNLSRRRLLQAAATIPAAAIPTLAIASPAHAGYLGNISRSNVMSRAHDWAVRNVQYDGNGYAWDNDHGHQYRRDCSGFVSMAWHSNCTDPDGGHSTRTLSNIAPKISWDILRAGDIINIYDNHCMLFDKWSDNSGYVWMYDLANPELDMRHEQFSISSLKNQGYQPRRYDKIFNG